MASHMFVFYFAVLSMITPPVGLATIAAAGIAGARMFPTGLQGMRLALPALIVPFAFVYHPAIILEGATSDVFWGVASLIGGVVALACALIGWARTRCRPYEVIALLAAAFMLIAPGAVSNALGTVLLIGVLALQTARTKKGVEPLPS